jgi:hypothetical protein
MVQSGFKHLLTEGDKVLQLVELVNARIQSTRHTQTQERFSA